MVEKSFFSKRVIAVVRGIPAGETRTYKEVAELAGSSGASRAVGTILHQVWQTDRGRTIPCHRVIRSDGSIGGYAGGTDKKRQLIQKERLVSLNKSPRAEARGTAVED